RRRREGGRGPRDVTGGGLGQPERLEVAGERGLRHRDAPPAQPPLELLLGADRALAHQAEDLVPPSPPASGAPPIGMNILHREYIYTLLSQLAAENGCAPCGK